MKSEHELMESIRNSLLKTSSPAFSETSADVSQNVSVLVSEAPRLSRQCKLILDRLRAAGGVSNRELSQVALKYTSRLSEIRAAGYKIKVSRHGDTGLVTYELDGVDVKA